MLRNQSQNAPKSIPNWNQNRSEIILGIILDQHGSQERFLIDFEIHFQSENPPKIHHKIKTFSSIPKNSFYTIRAPKKLQNDLQNPPQNQPFSQEDQILKILLSPRREPSFRGLDTYKMYFFLRTHLTTSLKAVLATRFYRFIPK